MYDDAKPETSPSSFDLLANQPLGLLGRPCAMVYGSLRDVAGRLRIRRLLGGEDVPEGLAVCPDASGTWPVWWSGQSELMAVMGGCRRMNLRRPVPS